MGERRSGIPETRGGVLFVVSTPIGNLEDMTPRAVRVLREAHLVVAEDTRYTRALCTHFHIATPLESLHAHTGEEKIAALVRRLLSGETHALVTDAGTPGISDPGEPFIREAIRANIPVVPIPGPSAVLAALVGSGLVSSGRFRFFGFLPKGGSERTDMLSEICRTPESVVLFEAPTRVSKTLADLSALTPSRKAVIARELTKLHEEFIRGTLEELALRTEPPRGEVVLVLGPAPTSTTPVSDDEILGEIRARLLRGEHPRTIAKLVAAANGLPQREVYSLVLQAKTERP